MIKKILLMVLLAAPLSLAAQKYAHFDYTTVMQSMPEVQKAQTELEALGKQYQTELENMGKEYQTKVEKFQNEVTETTPAPIRERRIKEIQDLETRLQQAREDNQKAFQEEQQKKMQPLIQKAMDAVNAIAKEGGYIYIIDKSASQAAGIFINETISEDVTEKVMKKLGISGKAATPAATTK